MKNFAILLFIKEVIAVLISMFNLKWILRIRKKKKKKNLKKSNLNCHKRNVIYILYIHIVEHSYSCNNIMSAKFQIQYFFTNTLNSWIYLNIFNTYNSL